MYKSTSMDNTTTNATDYANGNAIDKPIDKAMYNANVEAMLADKSNTRITTGTHTHIITNANTKIRLIRVHVLLTQRV